MKLTRAVAALLMVLGAGTAGAFVGAGPAYAGNWATTVLDPVPDRFEPDTPYRITFWVLQHGSHPYDGTLDPVALQLVGPGGAATTFTGAALPEPAHYVTTIRLPAAGDYTVIGLQGIFQPFRVGTLTAPGALTVLPVPAPLQIPAETLPWTDVRPPNVPIDPQRNPFDDTTAAPVAAAGTTTPVAAPEPGATRPASGNTRPTATVLIVLAGLAVLLGLFLYRRRPSPGHSPRH